MRSLRNNLLYSSGNSLGGSSESSEEQPHRHHPHSHHSKQYHNRHRPRSAAGFYDYDDTCIEQNDSSAGDAGKTRRPLSSTIGYSGQLFNKRSDLTTASATAAFEANMLRGNLRRDSFRVSRNGTANFVENPLFEDD